MLLRPEARTFTRPSTKAATSEFVVPRSIPKIKSLILALSLLLLLRCRDHGPLSPAPPDRPAHSIRSLRDKWQPLSHRARHRFHPIRPPTSAGDQRAGLRSEW